MKVLFIVQGEGRGHMTQALSLSQVLARQGHRLCAVLVGKSQSRVIPKFFLERIGAPVSVFDSPNFKPDSRRKGVSILGTFLENVRRFPSFLRSMRCLHHALRSHQPDVVVNFYDIMAAIYCALWRPKPKMICIAHQYLMLHPDFVFPKGKRIAIRAMLLYSRVCAWGADSRAALSFRKMEDLPEQKLVVMPPLLRAELRRLRPSQEDFILVYVLNDGYAENLAEAHLAHPELKILGFWDRNGAPETMTYRENLVFRQLDDVAFLDAMSRCKGLVSTAGFESVCEAMYLGKPVYMVPTGHQIEQHCNAIDAYLAGAGLWGFEFDLERFLRYLPRHRFDAEPFRRWADSAERLYTALIDTLVSES
jgi:uncharacterized protein (TIGR00661 family)